ncbi:unnamed protein product [Pedinophyceae sp. YPF-701]|nr:unnamed protein product [Pedinophyceae sp. YPF-701]
MANASQDCKPRLRFCPNTSDLLYAEEDKERRVLVYRCKAKNCGYEEDAEHGCAYRHVLKHSKQGEMIRGDMTDDPTLPRTNDYECPECGHKEAVYKQQATVKGMDVYYMCVQCGTERRDNA